MNAQAPFPARITHYQVPGRFGSVDYLHASALVGIDRDRKGTPESYTFHVGAMRCVHYDADEVTPVDMSED
jgi:hypothetical protein